MLNDQIYGFVVVRGSCETPKGLKKEKEKIFGEGRGKTAPVFLWFVCSFLFFFVVIVVFLFSFSFRKLSFASCARWGRESTAMPANETVIICPRSAVLLPCFVRVQKDACARSWKTLNTYNVA